MKICIITFGPVLSKSNGYFIRVWNLIEKLSKSNELIVLEFPEMYSHYTTNKRQYKKYKNNITFIQLHGNEYSSSHISNLLKKILTFDPFHNIRFQIISFFELWRHRKYISSADIVFVEGSLILSGNIVSKILGKKVVLDTHCINKLLARGYRKRNPIVYIVRAIFWDFLERLTMKLSDIVLVVSENEKQFVVKEYNVLSSKVFVVPNVIKQSRKKVSEEIVRSLRKKLGLWDKIVVTFVGNLESVQNADAVEFILHKLAPEFWRERKDVVFLVIGKGAEKFKHTLPNVVFTGFVGELEPYLQMSDILIAPLRVGAGTKTKILEYLSYEKPIVTTPIGIEGLENIVLNNPNVYVSPISMLKESLKKAISSDRKKANLKKNRQLNQSLYRVFKRNLNKAIRGAIE